MATKKYRLPVTVGVADPDLSRPQILDKDGRLVQAASVAIRHVPPGTVVEMDEAEAERIIARHGPYRQTVVTTEAEVDPVRAAPAQVQQPTQVSRRP